MAKTAHTNRREVDRYFRRLSAQLRGQKRKRVCFVVVGSAGDYEEKSWWPVAVFESHSHAEEFAKLTSDVATRLIAAHKRRLTEYYEDETGNVADPGLHGRRNKYYPDMWEMCGVDDPNYSVSKVRFLP